MPQINAKKFYREKKQAKRVKMPAAANFFFSHWHCDFQLFIKELFTVEALRF